MRSIVYNVIDSKESWYCCQCGIPNFASSLFDSEIRLSDSSSNTTTSRTGSVDSNDSFESPLATSSPNKTGRISDKSSHVKSPYNMSVMVVNFQSIKNKSAELAVCIEVDQPDIIIGTETWIDN
jgi:hypothetical protein